MNSVLERVRSKYPDYDSVSDDELTLRIGVKYPAYLDVPDFKADFDRLSGVSAPKPKSAEYLAMQQEQARLREQDAGSTAAAVLGHVEGVVSKIANPIGAILELPEQAMRAAGLNMPYTAKAPLVTPEAATKAVEFLTPGGKATEGTVGRAVQEFVAENISPMTSPEMVGLVAAGTKAPVPVGRYFQGQMLSQLPASVSAVSEAPTGEEKTKAALGVAANVAFPALIEGGIQRHTRPAVIEQAVRVGPATAEAAIAAAEAEGKIVALKAPVEADITQPALNVGDVVHYGVVKGVITEDRVLPSGARSVRMRVTEAPDSAVVGKEVGIVPERAVAQPVETPKQATAQAQAEVSRVAATEGKRTAKQIKEELIARLEEAEQKAPSAVDIGPTTPRLEPVRITIPGDGDFTVPNTKEAIGQVVKSAKRLTTSPNPLVGTVGARESATRQSILKRDVEDAVAVYGSREVAYERLKSQLERADELELEKPQRERLTRLVTDLEPLKARERRTVEPEVEARGSARRIFDFDDRELFEFFERAPAVEKLGRSKYPFANYTEFNDWMLSRYGERDLAGMREAFSEVGAPFKVRFIKEHKGASDHLKDWISHLATGSPLPSVDPPKPRTTPRPMPGAWQAPPPGGTGQRPPGGGPSAGATPPGTTPPPPPPPKPPPPSPMPTAPVGKVPKEPVRASEIIKDLSDVMERPIRFGHMAQGKATIGIFKTKAEVARIRRANDVPTAAHETAHMLERVHRKALGGISRKDWYRTMPADALSELRGMDYDPTQQRAYEGFAEFVRHWITEGDTAQIAPRTHAWFENTFLNQNPGLADGLRSIRDKGMAFRNQGAVKRVESMVEFEPKKVPLRERLVRKLHDIRRLWIDDLADLERVEKEVIGGDKLAYGEASPTKIARTVTQASGTRARAWARHGLTDFAGNKIGPSLKEIFGREGIAGDEKTAILYAVARRSQELHNRGIDPGITAADAGHALQSLRTPAREQFASEIAEWNEGALAYLRDAGGISKETFDTITTQNESYVPFFRVWEQESARSFLTGGRRIGDTPQPIKRIKGSGREILNPLESMQQHANQIISTADKVRVARALVQLAESKEGFGKYVERIPGDKIPVQFDLERIAKQVKAAGGDLSQADLDAVLTIFQNSPRTPTGGNVVGFVRNGKRQFYELDPELYRAIQALDYHRIHPVLDAVAGTFSRTVRLGATGIRAGFTLITNPIRDFATMLLQTGGNPVEAAGRFFQQMAKQVGMQENQVKSIWRATGGELSQPLGLDRASLRKAADDVLNNTLQQKAFNVIKHPVEFVRAAMSFTEAAPRLAEFEMSLRQAGWKPGQPVTESMAIEAANKAAEVTLNFRRAGHYGRAMNQIIAFWNPAVQGLSKFTRSHTDSKIQSVARGIGFVTIPAMLNWWANKDDKDWQNFPPWLKYGFLNFKVGGEWVRIPTPFEWWYAYGALPIASAETLYREKPEEMEKMFTQAIKQSTPPVLPSVAVPLIEAGMNESFYTGRPIVSKSAERLAPQEQVKPHTSATARKVSDILSAGGVEVSPAKVEHILNGETGGFFSDMIHAAEVAVGQAPPTAMLEPADLPIVGRLFIRDGSSIVIDEFYTTFEHLAAKQATWKKLLAEDSPRASKYELTEQQHGQLNAMERLSKTLSKLREQYRDSKTREERNKLWREMLDVATTALEIE